MEKVYLDRDVDLTEGALFGKPLIILDPLKSVSLADYTEGMGRIDSFFDFTGKVDFPWNNEFTTINSESDLNKPTEFNDPLFDYLGFAFYGDVDEPFFMGEVNRTMGKKELLEEEYGGYCIRCGAKITVYDSNQTDMCDKCEIEFRGLNLPDIESYLIDYETSPRVFFVDNNTLALSNNV